MTTPQQVIDAPRAGTSFDASRSLITEHGARSAHPLFKLVNLFVFIEFTNVELVA